MSNTQNLDLKKMDGNPKVVNFNHKEFYENNFDKIDDAVGAKPADLTTTANTIIPAINELKSDKADKTYVDDQDAALTAQLAERAMKSEVGTLTNLLTTAKTSIVDAINELFNSKANKTQEAWITPTLQNGWVEYDVSRAPKYFKDTLGMVHLKGVVKSGTGTIYTLPIGYRPSSVVYVATVSDAKFGYIQITAGGVISMPVGSNAWVSLENITFKSEL